MKRLAVQLHLWLGLTVGLLWAVQGLTGATLVFHRELDRWANPVRVGSAGPMADANDLIAMAERVTGSAPVRVGIVDARPDMLGIDYQGLDGGTRTLFVNAATGRPLGERLAEPSAPVPGSTSRFIYNLHENLAAGDNGHTLIGVSGLLLLASALTGLWVAWPRRRQWRQLASFDRWRSTPQKLYGWHRLVGLTVGVLFVAIATGGAYMVFSKSVRPAVAELVPHELPYKPVPLAQAPLRWASAQAALDAARARFPEAGFVRLTLPSAKAPVYAIRLHQPGEARAWSGTTTVTVDALSGEVLHVYDAVHAPLSNRVADALFSVHNGEIAGLAGRLLVMTAGLSLPLFYVTGVWLWLARRRRARPVLSPAE